jgi:hypothetical protein
LNLKTKKELEQINKGNPKITLRRACRINDGIELLSKNEIQKLVTEFDKSKNQLDITFFTPASGSGSRMFGALYDFLDDANISNQKILEFVELILHKIESFPFYNYLPQSYKKSLENGDIDINELIKFILYEEGLNYGQMPKGLIPFHTYGEFIINPFQEQILQGVKIANEEAKFHFTINPTFKNNIDESIKILKQITGLDFTFSFSEQQTHTHSIAFTEDNKVAEINNEPILRPSGHGALLDNLNNINSDIIFIKNIDNIQHSNQAKKSISTKKGLAGLLIDFQSKVKSLLLEIDENSDNFIKSTSNLNKSFNLKLSQNQLSDKQYLFNFFNRPIRICGMVKNEGQAGGGPFWVEDSNGQVTKQIIEKSQIDPKQRSIMLHATHFNPVDIVCWMKDYKGHKFDLNNYSNQDLYFIVNKTQFGIPIKYIEKPGLWNGGMYNWLTLFYEIDSNCFSPVKTVLDLLKPLHQED